MWLNFRNYNIGEGDYDKEVEKLENTKKYYENKYKTIENKDLIINEYINTHEQPKQPILPNGTST